MKPKHLAVIGNSLGVVIEKPVLRMLGIGPDTELKLFTDGTRIIIEPAHQIAVPKASSIERRHHALRTVRELLQRGLDSHFAELGEGVRRTRYEARLDTGSEADDQTERIMARLQVCADGLRAGRLWADVVRAAMAAVPRPS